MDPETPVEALRCADHTVCSDNLDEDDYYRSKKRCDDVDAGESIIKGLCIYMGEDLEYLPRECVGMDEDVINETIKDMAV
ncbi:uncharacterized protein V6R79_019051 [Siganus canaliculatus]